MFHPVEWLNEWKARSNRQASRALDASDIDRLWLRHPSSRDLGSEDQAAPELMVILTTYHRPASAARLLNQLRAALARDGSGRRVALLVLHDAGESDYSLAQAAAASIGERHLWLDARQRFGKPGFWRMHQTAFDVARLWRPKRALYLQDDVEFEPDMLERAERIWRATEQDPSRRVLYLFSSRDDEAQGRWVSFARRELSDAQCRLTNWFDLQAFMVDERFFELLAHQMIEIHPNRWKRQPGQSSGVGRQFTLRLFGRASVYQAWPPLVAHGREPSRMNPEARLQRALDNRREYSALRLSGAPEPH